MSEIPASRRRWIKASASIGMNACVELAKIGEQVALRDSKNPDGRYLSYTEIEWAAFLDGAKKGEFDHLVESGRSVHRPAGPDPAR